MEESQSQKSSDFDWQEYALETFEQLKLNAAILVILLEQAGGLAEFTKEELESIDVSAANARLHYDEDRNVYVLEGVYVE